MNLYCILLVTGYIHHYTTHTHPPPGSRCPPNHILQYYLCIRVHSTLGHKYIGCTVQCIVYIYCIELSCGVEFYDKNYLHSSTLFAKDFGKLSKKEGRDGVTICEILNTFDACRLNSRVCTQLKTYRQMIQKQIFKKTDSIVARDYDSTTTTTATTTNIVLNVTYDACETFCDCLVLGSSQGESYIRVVTFPGQV